MLSDEISLDPSRHVESCDLCIVGAGIAGLNALFAASRYLNKKHKIILIDKRPNCGGMWTETYDYVRLHQPPPMFTVGNIRWTFNKRSEYLATKDEVVSHLQYCVEKIRENVTLVEHYGYEYLSHEETQESGVHRAEILFKSLVKGQTDLCIVANRCVKAFGFNVPKNIPLPIKSRKVESVTPHDLRLLSTDDELVQKPVYIIGGGKTAMDTAHELLKRTPERKIHLVVGKGTLFLNRNRVFPPGIKRWLSGVTATYFFTDIVTDIAQRFDGDNETDVLRYFRQKYTVKLDDNFSQYMFGILSEEENKFIFNGVSSVTNDYFLDVVDQGETSKIIFKSGKEKQIESGSLIVNCTGYLFKTGQAYEPYLSKNGTVVSIQSSSSIHFLSTFAAYFLVHLLYLGKLDKLPLYELDQNSLAAKDKILFPFVCVSQLLLNTLLIIDAVPMSVMLDCYLDYERWYPIHRRLINFAKLMINKNKYQEKCRKSLDRVRERTQIHCGIPNFIEHT